MRRVSWLVVLTIFNASNWFMTIFADYSTVEIYSDANCESIPLVVTLEVMNTTCTPSGTCNAIEINNSSYYYAQQCTTDRFKYTSQLFSGAKYLMIDGFQEEGCESYVRSNVFLAAGTCQLASYVGQRSEIATLFRDGSAYMTVYSDSACAKKTQVFDLNTSIIQDHTCYKGYNKFYTSDHTGIVVENTSDSGSNLTTPTMMLSHESSMSTGALFGIVVTCLGVVIVPILLIYWRMHHSKQKREKSAGNSRAQPPDISLVVSGKHESDERYAPDLSPKFDRKSSHSGHALRNERKCEPTPVHWKDERTARGNGLRRLPNDRFGSDSIGRLHTNELHTASRHSSRLQREDLSDGQNYSDPIPSDHRQPDHKWDGPYSDKVMNDRDHVHGESIRSNWMQDFELSRQWTPSEPEQSTRAKSEPLHAHTLRGPVTADSVCEDDAVLSSRISRDKVIVEDLIGRGGYGEVYRGTYEGRAVAVKMLFPETRKSTRHVTEFLTEVKMMTIMDHPRVVEYIGVSWNNLMDLCAVTEFMAGGDLRAWLSERADNANPVGFDYTKIKIATHVAHALAYLHALTPCVIHRDLKSKNILLDENHNAKLADFGASRERIDVTMTAGVGTSLWIAPEVMMGERYDDKADIFSFGVVLSELDSQQNPYAHAKEKSSLGRKMPDTAILQLVAMGKLRVEFSLGAQKGMVQLGMACTAIDPTERPSAAQAFQMLEKILAQEAKKRGNVE